MKKSFCRQQGEKGFILVTVLLFLLVLTIIGIAVNRNTTIELQIAGNDRTHKETFYRADGGTELAQELIEQNIACLTFGSSLLSGDNDNLYGVQVTPGNLGFWRNFTPINPPADNDNARTFYYPVYNAGEPHTNFSVGGSTKMTIGAAIQMAAGYEGKGKGIGGAGAMLVYDIYSQHIGKNDSESIIYVEYRHILGNEGDCYYP